MLLPPAPPVCAGGATIVLSVVDIPPGPPQPGVSGCWALGVGAGFVTDAEGADAFVVVGTGAFDVVVGLITTDADVVTAAGFVVVGLTVVATGFAVVAADGAGEPDEEPENTFGPGMV